MMTIEFFFVILQSKRIRDMTSITLDYDEKNLIIKKLIEAIIALGANEWINELDKAIMEVESGDTIKCKDFDDYLTKMNA